MAMSWADAKAGQRNDEFDDDWKEKQARVWVDRLRKEFGSKLRDQPEIAAMTLEL